LLTAAPDLAGGLARLARLRRVDPEQPDALAVNFDRVAVDHRRTARQVTCGGWPRAADGQG